MATTGEPEIAGPEAHKVEVVPVQGEVATEKPAGPAEQTVLDSVKPEAPPLDPSFPFGRPENIDYKILDEAGHDLIKELNLRPWVKTVEYCSGHPLDRFPEEQSELYPYATGENVYEEIAKLDMAYLRGLVNDTYFKHRKTELRSAGATRFYLNMNVYNLGIFLEWTRLLSALIIATTNSGLYPLIVRLNPLRPGVNVSVYWDYWTLEERDMIHDLFLVSLNNFPV
jgi:hypothetical protein